MAKWLLGISPRTPPSTSLHHRPTSASLNSTKPILLISSYSVSFPTRPSRRKNHLRQKILKTLENPIIPKCPPSNPTNPIVSLPPREEEYDSVQIQEAHEIEKPKNSETVNEKTRKPEEVRMYEVLGSSEASIDENIASSPISKHWQWLVVAFVFQTISAIWIFSSAGSISYKNQMLSESKGNSVPEFGGIEKGKSKVKSNIYQNGTEKMGAGDSTSESITYANELKMERRIEEIRVMAKEAREMERLGSKKNGIHHTDEIGAEKYSKNEIHEEVGDRLVKLRKRLETARAIKPVASVEYLRKQSEAKDKVGIHDKGVYEGDVNGELLFKKKYRFKGGPTKQVEKPKGFVGSTGTNVNGAKKQKAKDGIVSKKNKGKKFEGEAVMKPRKYTSFQESKSGTNCWWLNLPYVTVIVLRSGLDDDGVEGFYTLKNTDEQMSRMVAFEDRTDATNFCYILQSFRDLEDIEADIVPLTIEELNESAKYCNAEVLVVKKRQLRLYAGQSLIDVEIKLRAMI